MYLSQGEKPRIIELGVVLNADTIKHLLNHLYGHDYQPNAPQGRDVEAAKGVIDHVKLYNLAGKYALPVLQAEVLATVETCLVELRCTIAQEAGSYHSLACDLANLESHAEAGAWSEEELQESIARTKADASDGRNQVNEILLAVAPAILEAYEGAVSADRAMKDLFLSVARRDRIQWFPRDENSGGTLPASRNLFATCPDFAYELASEETPKERRMHQRAFGYRVESPVEDSTQLWV